MTTEELKAHQLTICKALIDGKQCQVKTEGIWVDSHTSSVAYELFAATKFHDVRIKPEPRKVWVKWNDGVYGGPPVSVAINNPRQEGWQLVEEEVK
jgi:hypothetical protein